jgi:hypothetical protein
MEHEEFPVDQFLSFFKGNLLCVAGGITAIVVTGGSLLPVVIGLGAASVALGLGGGIANLYFTSKNKAKQDEHTKDLVKALITDCKSYKQFEEDFSQLDDDELFQFTLWLKNSKQYYSGKGKKEFKKRTNIVLPNLKEIKIKDKAGKEFLKKVLEAAEKADQEERQQINRTLLNFLTNNIGAGLPAAATLGREFTEEAVKGVVGTAAKVVGGLAIGIGILLWVTISEQSKPNFLRNFCNLGIGQKAINTDTEIDIKG